MKQITKQTHMQNATQENNIWQRILKVIFGIIEMILAFRFVFKLMGASSGNKFVQGIYNITHPFVKIFEGIFSRSTASGSESVGVFEPATLIAMLIIGIIALIIMTLMPSSGKSSRKSEYTEHEE